MRPTHLLSPTHMDRAAYNVRLLTQRLNHLGYEFATEAHTAIHGIEKEWAACGSELGASPVVASHGGTWSAAWILRRS